MPQIQQNGPDFKYIVTYQRADIQGAKTSIAIIQQPTAWHYVCPDSLPTYVPFNITVKANNAYGDSSAPLYAITGYSGEDGTYILILFLTVNCANCFSVTMVCYRSCRKVPCVQKNVESCGQFWKLHVNLYLLILRFDLENLIQQYIWLSFAKAV